MRETMKTEENVVFHSKVIRLILICLYKKKIDYGYNVSKEIKSTWSDVQRKLKILEEQEQLVEHTIEERKGKGLKKLPSKREKYYKLTKKGEEIAKLLLKINKILNKEARG